MRDSSMSSIPALRAMRLLLRKIEFAETYRIAGDEQFPASSIALNAREGGGKSAHCSLLDL
jgi:hypothetical protein